MAGLYKVPSQNAHSVFPREGAEERLDNGIALSRNIFLFASVSCF